MGWEKGRYYTRSRKLNGRVVREYVGGGRLGQLAAQLDVADRTERAAEAAELKSQMKADREQERMLAEYCKQVDALVAEGLTAAGYHKHKGQWRRKRGKEEEAS